VTQEEFRLDDKHLEKAKEIAVGSRKRRSCNLCYDRGWTGVAQDNTIVLCHKCVDGEKAFTEWKDYVAGIPELREHYSELFEEEAAEEEEE
jgi:hypothetical protein